MLPCPLLTSARVLSQAGAETLVDEWARYAAEFWEMMTRYLASMDMLIQIGAVLGSLTLAYFLHAGLAPLVKRLAQESGISNRWLAAAVGWLQANLFRLLLVMLLWSASIYFDAANRRVVLVDAEPALAPAEPAASRTGPDGQVLLRQATRPPVSVPAVAPIVPEKNYLLLRAFASLATLWLVAGALPRTLRGQAYFKTLFFVLAVGLVLNLLGLWEAIRGGLDRLQLLPVVDGAGTRVTALTLVKGLIAILIIIPLSAWALKLSERQIRHSENVSPALQVLISKVVKAMIVVVTALFCISSIGIDLSALAVMGGAIGLGLGFGFQKVVSNLVSGVILLADRSIKPGDVIEVDDTYGWINKLSARYVSVITRDGMEHLIPNEVLITEKVTNWSFSDDFVRVKVPFGVSYASDIHQVMDLAVEAARASPRVVADREPVCWLKGFGDSSVDFELRIWIRDPANGLVNLRSSIYVKLWDLFKEHGIEIPFPQRDLNLRGGEPIRVSLRREDAAPGSDH